MSHLLKNFSLYGGLFFMSFVFTAKGEKTKAESQTAIVIKNELSAEGQSAGVTASALVPSNASKLRDARKKQEIQTEDRLIKELEKQRLLEEQKRLDHLLGNTSPAPSQAVPEVSPAPLAPAPKEWVFGSKSFISFGAGAVTYPGVTNVKSIHDDIPTLFLSFGGYSHEGSLIFDLTLNYSQHYLNPHQGVFGATNPAYPLSTRLVYYQPSASMSIKFSPLKGRMKPYIGLSGALVFRSEETQDEHGNPLNFTSYLVGDPLNRPKDRAWDQSYDAGIALGADVALGRYLGLNVDLRYHWNLWAERSGKDDPLYMAYWNTVSPYFYHNQQKEQIGDRNSLIISANLRYYF